MEIGKILLDLLINILLKTLSKILVLLRLEYMAINCHPSEFLILSNLFLNHNNFISF